MDPLEFLAHLVTHIPISWSRRPSWETVAPLLLGLQPVGMALRYAGRPERASPAEGYPAAHAAAQARIVAEALG